jgi:phage recombination protein Bet
MSSVVPFRPAGQPTYDTKMLALIKRTVAAETTDDEFSLFIHMARSLNLDPLRRQIYAFVFSKDDVKKRRMSIVTAIDGFRAIADRTGNYRPDEDEPTYEVDGTQVSPTNPKGLVKATVRVFKFSHGSWHKVTASARWDEYAPIKDEWAENENGKWRPTGVKTLDTSGNWGKMPHLMLAKVAEALALRKAWPDDFSNVYAAEEIDRARVIDATPSELAAQGEYEIRQERIGGPAMSVSWDESQPLDRVPVGQFADRVMAFIRDHQEEPSTIIAWKNRNRVTLREFWAAAPSDSHEVKKALEKVEMA